MIAIDTNIVIRLLVDDPGQMQQVKSARDHVSKEGEVFIPQIVQVETIWVLESSYKLPKKQILMILQHLDKNAAYKLQHLSSFMMAFNMYTTGNADFSDYLILAESRKQQVKLFTFDKKLQKEPHTLSF